MAKNDIYLYYVEGECEEKLVKALKNKLIISGKIVVFDLVKEKISNLRLRTIKNKTNIIIIFDTDTKNIEILKNNLKLLSRSKNVKKIIMIPQVKNLEEELIFSTNIKNIKDLTKSKTNKIFKHDFIRASNVLNLLEEKQFKMNKLWCRNPNNIWGYFENNSKNIKL